MLLYAQPLSRILRLALSDITRATTARLHIRFGHPPAPVPEPFASLLPSRSAGRPATSSNWLFPGRNPGQPAAYGTVFTQLRDLGFPMRTARISALRQLVLQAPAPVIAEALGFHYTTTERQHTNAGATWNRYPGRRPHEVTTPPPQPANTHYSNTPAHQSLLVFLSAIDRELY